MKASCDTTIFREIRLKAGGAGEAGKTAGRIVESAILKLSIFCVFWRAAGRLTVRSHSAHFNNKYRNQINQSIQVHQR